MSREERVCEMSCRLATDAGREEFCACIVGVRVVNRRRPLTKVYRRQRCSALHMKLQ
jgi:hypothetical protein